jgi:thiol-disulfide isomerase/thioredoxin
MKNTLVTITAALLFFAGLLAMRYYITQQQDSAPSSAQLAPAAPLEDADEEDGSNTLASAPALPDLSFPDLAGNEHRLDEWKGKILVVNFWATWCPPCRKEIPAFNRVQLKYKDRGVQFIGIALDDVEAIQQFLKIIPIDYPVLVGGDDIGARAAHALGNEEGVLPYTVFITADGKVHAQVSGGLSEAATENTLNEML